MMKIVKITFVNCFCRLILLALVILLTLNNNTVNGIQCFSCKGTGTNELLANANCLENGYLENCDDFYDYYSKVDDKKVLTDNYYYDEYYDYDENAKSQPSSTTSNTNKRTKRQAKNTPGKAKNGSSEYEYEYYEYYVDENQDKEKPAQDDANNSKEANEEDSDSSIIPESSKKNLPKDPEHHCYSTTEKLDWEHYAIEKGCKKIAYCKMDEANKPAWGNPWNFCCGKSRCNAKLVKDKPQRIYAMPCRRTDDCIQGHTSRPVCPYMFKSCPKIPPAVIKMECRAKGIDPNDIKHRYRNPFQEKKCFCLPGYYPRGPICTSSGQSIIQSLSVLSTGLLLSKIIIYM